MVCYSDEHNYAFLPADATDADKQAAIAYLDAETTKRAKSFIHIPEKWK